MLREQEIHGANSGIQDVLNTRYSQTFWIQNTSEHCFTLSALLDHFLMSLFGTIPRNNEHYVRLEKEASIV